MKRNKKKKQKCSTTRPYAYYLQLKEEQKRKSARTINPENPDTKDNFGALSLLLLFVSMVVPALIIPGLIYGYTYRVLERPIEGMLIPLVYTVVLYKIFYSLFPYYDLSCKVVACTALLLICCGYVILAIQGMNDANVNLALTLPYWNDTGKLALTKIDYQIHLGITFGRYCVCIIFGILVSAIGALFGSVHKFDYTSYSVKRTTSVDSEKGGVVK